MTRITPEATTRTFIVRAPYIPHDQTQSGLLPVSDILEHGELGDRAPVHYLPTDPVRAFEVGETLSFVIGFVPHGVLVEDAMGEPRDAQEDARLNALDRIVQSMAHRLGVPVAPDVLGRLPGEFGRALDQIGVEVSDLPPSPSTPFPGLEALNRVREVLMHTCIPSHLFRFARTGEEAIALYELEQRVCARVQHRLLSRRSSRQERPAMVERVGGGGALIYPGATGSVQLVASPETLCIEPTDRWEGEAASGAAEHAEARGFGPSSIVGLFHAPSPETFSLYLELLLEIHPSGIPSVFSSTN